MKLTPTGETLGATIDGLDLSKELGKEDLGAVMTALGQYGVIRFPSQQLTGPGVKKFSSQLGDLEINVANSFQEPGHPEVMILSNIVEEGKPIGLSDAGQDWHTDMSYSRMIAFTNILYGIKIPVRDGVALGCTEFCNMHAAYDQLPAALKEQLQGMTATHDFEKFWDMMRRDKGSARPPLTPAQRAARPPATHPVFMQHPITGRTVLYCNPGYAVRINELPQAESDEVLAFLFEHQTQPRFKYRYSWVPRTVLMWDNMGTIHNAVADYRPDEHRLIKRCQVAATRFFETA